MLLIDVFFSHSLYGAASVSSQQVCDSQATCSFHRSAQQKQQNAPETRTVVIPSLKFYTLSSPRKTHLKRGISNQMCSCQLKGLSLQKIKSSHLTSCFSKKVYYLFFLLYHRGICNLLLYPLRATRLGWQNPLLHWHLYLSNTNPWPTMGVHWEKEKMQRKTRGDYQPGKATLLLL